MESIPEWIETQGALEWFAKVFAQETDRLLRNEDQKSKSWFIKG
jgi:hypothetical protein